MKRCADLNLDLYYMVYVELPDERVREVSFHLAMEEYVARRFDVPECFFTWQVEPSAIFGRNQVAQREVDLRYCREHGVKVFRRKSGGGCVYADWGNVMLSYVTSGHAVDLTFTKYMAMVATVLRKMGVKATVGGRNDILVGGRKVSGNAFYHLPGRSIVHGTMLFDTDMENMLGAITPANDKLGGKGVRSVAQRVALLKEFTAMTTGDFRSFVRRELCSGTLTLGAADVAAIEELEREYRAESFVLGNNPPFTIVRRGRVEGVGGLEAMLDMRGNAIRRAAITGDFLPGSLPLESLTKALEGAKLSPESLRQRLAGGEERAIMGLEREQLITILTETTA